MINYGRQDIDEADIDAVVQALRSPFLTQGPRVRQFEVDLEKLTGAKHCVAVANGTAALHLAVLAGMSVLGADKDCEGITSPITFAATSNAMLYAGVSPVFCDIELGSYNIDPLGVEESVNKRTRFLLPVHFAGIPADMERLAEIAQRNNLIVIEDAAHALGSAYSNGAMVGSCCYSDMTIFSFHPVKTVTTCEGGAITTNSDDLASMLRDLATHGITKDVSRMRRTEGSWYHEMQSLGFNYRLSDVHAALGSSQLSRLPVFREKRQAIITRYDEAFRGHPAIRISADFSPRTTCRHLYVLRIDYERLGIDRTGFMHSLKERGVGSQVHYIPVYRHPYYEDLFGSQTSRYPNSEEYYAEALSLPLYPSMTDEEVDGVIAAVLELSE